jgi:hypothetical protein
VRSFGKQVKHLAATNHILAAAALGEERPADAGDEVGPEAIRTKAEIIDYLNGSFAHLQRDSLLRTDQIAPSGATSQWTETLRPCSTAWQSSKERGNLASRWMRSGNCSSLFVVPPPHQNDGSSYRAGRWRNSTS